MKGLPGYTVMELLITVSLLTVLTGVSLLGIIAPRQLLEQETLLGQLSDRMERIQLEALLRGTTVKVSFTPWALWVDERKEMAFPRESGWQWRTDVKDVILQSDGSFSIINSKGRSETLPQEVALVYNQKRVAAIRLSPAKNTIQVARTSEINDTCPN